MPNIKDDVIVLLRKEGKPLQAHQIAERLHVAHPDLSVKKLYWQVEGLMRSSCVAFEQVVAGYKLGVHAMTTEEEKLIRDTAYAVLRKAKCSLQVEQIAELVATKNIPICKDNLADKVKLCVNTYHEFEDAGLAHYAAGSKTPRKASTHSRPWKPRETGTLVDLLEPQGNGTAYVPVNGDAAHEEPLPAPESVQMPKPYVPQEKRPGKGNRKKQEVKPQPKKPVVPQPGSLRYELYEIVKRSPMPINAQQAIELLRNKVDVNANTPFLVKMYFETRKDEYQQVVPGFYRAIEQKPQ